MPSHRTSLEVSYISLISKKQSVSKPDLTIKRWRKQVKTLFQTLLTDKLMDYKSEFFTALKKCNETDSMKFFRIIQWVDRSFQPVSLKSDDSTFQRSKIIASNIEPSLLSGSFDQARQSNSSFKKFLSIMAHEIKFGTGILTKIIECFTKIFIKKYGPNGNALGLDLTDSTKASPRTPLSFLYSSFSSLLKLKQTPPASTKHSTAEPDYNANFRKAITEIKAFRDVLIKLFQQQTQYSKNFANVTWTSEENFLVFEAVNGLLFGWSDQFYLCIMSLIGSVLREKQAEFANQTDIMKHWSTKEFQIHTPARLQGESHAYLGAIEAMNMISQHFTPEDKFKSIHAVQVEIARGADNQWEEDDLKKSVRKPIDQEDQLLHLYTYVISRCDGGKLLCDLYFVEQFLEPEKLTQGEFSFAFNILNSTVSHVLSLKKQKAPKNSGDDF